MKAAYKRLKPFLLKTGKKLSSQILITTLLVVIFVCFGSDVVAQCPMCKLSAESNLKGGGNAGKGLNMGILYMLIIPYLLISFLVFMAWKNRKEEKK